jgi:hypothetical protein
MKKKRGKRGGRGGSARVLLGSIIFFFFINMLNFISAGAKNELAAAEGPGKGRPGKGCAARKLTEKGAAHAKWLNIT